MATFPTNESDILAHAQELVGGLTGNPLVFPAPPVNAVALQALVDSFVALRDQANAAHATAVQVTLTKGGALEELTDAMKANYTYAETTVADDVDKLLLIGWSGRKAATAPILPGIPRQLEAAKQGEGWVFLDWKTPTDGGPITTYQVERRERPSGDWIIAGMALKTELMLTNQQRAKDWEYRVVGVNTTGLGEPSTTVAVVL